MLKYEIGERLKELSYIIKESPVNYLVTQEKDKSLKGLFEVKKYFVQLIKTFVKEPWIENISEEKLMKKERKSDMALIDLIPGAIEIFRDEGRKEGMEKGIEKGKKEGKIRRKN